MGNWLMEDLKHYEYVLEAGYFTSWGSFRHLSFPLKRIGVVCKTSNVLRSLMTNAFPVVNNRGTS